MYGKRCKLEHNTFNQDDDELFPDNFFIGFSNLRSTSNLTQQPPTSHQPSSKRIKLRKPNKHAALDFSEVAEVKQKAKYLSNHHKFSLEELEIWKKFLRLIN